ncbi:hypothetical protein GCM10011511_53710 [Puia dinghuensis]|uniref:T9SS C-terminal target domain-containing protein n=2 Tax=Puia dinghuensis TaxID=1792502 RepID=A0A8J2UJ04_9BACT|nr:hypothetical protein GCM10011511_53710 [Puia dinghuensis]
MLASANVYNVTSTTDGTATNQLRGAIAAADAAGGINTINLAAGTYVLTLGEIKFGSQAGTLTIAGAGPASTTIQMSTTKQDRIFLINTTGKVFNVSVSIQGITFTGGVLTSDAFGGGAILCGGPLNTMSLVNCVFTSNSSNKASLGGAVAMEGGGDLTVSGCTFSNNTNPKGNGGALHYFMPNSVTVGTTVTNLSGSLSISNCTFSGNTCGNTTSGGPYAGGAIDIEIQGTLGGTTSTVSMTQNTFVNNKALGSTSEAGAIVIANGFAAGNTAFINYNRFYANTAHSIPDVVMNSASGNVDVTNNWWGINGGPVAAGDPHVAVVGSGGSGVLTSSPWLRLTSNVSATTVCGGSGTGVTVTAGFLTNSASALVSASNLGALAGVPVSFSATLGSISGAQATMQSSGVATATFYGNGTAGTATVQPIVDSVTSTDVVARVQVTETAPTPGTTSTSGSVTVGTNDPVITDASCNRICYVAPSGAQPVSGTVNASVTMDASVRTYNGNQYLTRHYDIQPVAGASTATAMVTLYYLQSEFNAYNALVSGAANMLPTGPADAVGKANLTITQFHGTGTAPGGYSGWAGSGPATVLINPGATNVVWDATNNFWAVSFPVTGFSGFYASGPAGVGIPLPVVLESFGGMPQAGGVLLTWKVGVETGLASYEVETSVDGVGYAKIGSVAPRDVAAYQFFQADPAAGNDYYRLRMVNLDGTFAYSTIVVVHLAAGEGSVVQVLGNPVRGACTIRVVAAAAGMVSLRLADMSGKTLWVGRQLLGAGENTFLLPEMAHLVAGIYLLTVDGAQLRATVKVVKE